MTKDDQGYSGAIMVYRGLSRTGMDWHGLSQTKILYIGNKQTDKQTLLDVKSLLQLKILVTETNEQCVSKL